MLCPAGISLFLYKHVQFYTHLSPLSRGLGKTPLFFLHALADEARGAELIIITSYPTKANGTTDCR